MDILSAGKMPTNTYILSGAWLLDLWSAIQAPCKLIAIVIIAILPIAIILNWL